MYLSKNILKTTRIFLIWYWKDNLAITQNWLGSLRRDFFFHCWLLCEVTDEENIVHCWRCQSFDLPDGFLNVCWFCWEEGSFPYSLWYCHVSSKKLTAGLGAPALLFFSTWSYHLLFTNKWLHTISIIQPSNLYQLRSNILSCFPAYKLWYMSE